MKKILILPSTTGQGDLAVAFNVASALQQYFRITTAFFAQNSQAPLLSEIPGEKVMFPSESHPNHSGSYIPQVRALARQIKAQAADITIALNEATFSIAAFIARSPLIQLTHFMDPASIQCGRKVLSASSRLQALRQVQSPCNMKNLTLDEEGKLLSLLGHMHNATPFSGFRRALRKFNSIARIGRSARLRSTLIHRYGRLLGANYLGLLLADELIVHSVFAPDPVTRNQINEDRQLNGRSPLRFTSSIQTPLQPEPPPASIPGPKIVLLTFGGINHPITTGFARLIRMLDRASSQFRPDQLRIILAGRVTGTQRTYLETALSENPLFRANAIEIRGSLAHREHLQLIASSDLVLTQPGYSTLCELIAMAKPFALFYGLAPYYEQFANFLSAYDSHLLLNPWRQPWLQVGEYGTFGSPRFVREHSLITQLRDLFGDLVEGTLTPGSSCALNNGAPYYIDTLLLTARQLAARSTQHQQNNLEIAV